MHRSFLPIAAFLLIALGLGACGSSAKSTGPVTTDAPMSTASVAPENTAAVPAVSGPTITISSGFKFSVTPVKAGATVTVRNDSTAQHTVSADTTAGGFDVTSDPGKTVTFTAPSKPGSYGFHCNIHTFMKATLTVT